MGTKSFVSLETFYFYFFTEFGYTQCLFISLCVLVMVWVEDSAFISVVHVFGLTLEWLCTARG